MVKILLFSLVLIAQVLLAQNQNVWISTDASRTDKASKSWVIDKTTGAFILQLKSTNFNAFTIKTYNN